MHIHVKEILLLLGHDIRYTHSKCCTNSLMLSLIPSPSLRCFVKRDVLPHPLSTSLASTLGGRWPHRRSELPYSRWSTPSHRPRPSWYWPLQSAPSAGYLEQSENSLNRSVHERGRGREGEREGEGGRGEGRSECTLKIEVHTGV